MTVKYESRSGFYSKYTEYQSSEVRESSFMTGRQNEESEMPYTILVMKDVFPSNIETVEFIGRSDSWSNLLQANSLKTEIYEVTDFDDVHKQLVKVKRVLEVAEGGIETEIVKKKKGE